MAKPQERKNTDTFTSEAKNATDVSFRVLQSKKAVLADNGFIRTSFLLPKATGKTKNFLAVPSVDGRIKVAFMRLW